MYILHCYEVQFADALYHTVEHLDSGQRNVFAVNIEEHAVEGLAEDFVEGHDVSLVMDYVFKFCKINVHDGVDNSFTNEAFASDLHFSFEWEVFFASTSEKLLNGVDELLDRFSCVHKLNVLDRDEFHGNDVL